MFAETLVSKSLEEGLLGEPRRCYKVNITEDLNKIRVYCENSGRWRILVLNGVDLLIILLEY